MRVQQEHLMRWMAWLCFLVWHLFAGIGVQAATYAYRSDTFAYDTPSAGAASVTWHSSGASPACTSFPNGDDDWADIAFPAGFTFTYGGVAYSSVRVYSNGFLAFPPDVSGFHRNYTPQALPITTAGPALTGCANAVPQNLMIAYWVDIIAGTASSVTNANVKSELLTDGAGQKRFVITWNNVALYGNAATRYSFQIALFESVAGVNGNFRYQYTTGSTTGLGATVGVQLNTADYTQFAYNQNFIDTVVGTAILWYPANQLAAKSAEYRFDESSWTGAAGEVKDTSGNLKNASRLGSSANVAAGKLCRGATFTNNTSNAVIDAVATPLVPAATGSVDFWYKSNVAWSAASSDAMLLDATTIATRPFFLMKRATGALRFAVTDSAGTVLTAETSTAYSFAAGTWHHIAISWRLAAGTNQTVLQIIVDGALANTIGTTPYRSTSSGAIAALSTLYIGDNRTSGITPSNGSPNGANGTIDEVYVYNVDINATQAAADMALTRPTCTSLDHFHIVHGGELVNCGGAVASITVEAHDANHALISLAGTSMQMSTSTAHGTWSGISTINPVSSGAGTGIGSYTFSNESSVTFGLANTFSEALNINLISGSVTESSGIASTCVANDYTFGSSCDANLNFVDAGYQFDVLNHVSEASQSVTVKAVRKSDNSSACVPVFASVSRNLTFTCGYLNPATGTLPVRVGGRALNAANAAASQCDATGQAVSLSFNATGVATTTVQYADVGNMTLSARETTAGITMTGTDTFIAAPGSFAFSAITAAPIKAGASFGATVTARNSANAATPNFGRELPAEGISLTHVRAQPTGSGAVNGSFSGNVGVFSAGIATATNLVWSEVGTIDLSATLVSGSYLGSGLTATGTTGAAGAVGRFIPDHFSTSVTQACVSGGFTYSGQPFTTTVTALNLAGGVTLNYDGSANTTPNFSKVTTLSNGGSVTNFSGNSLAVASFSGGVGAASGVAYTFPVKQTAPQTITLRATDTDGVASGAIEGSALIRSGRLRMLNAYGSELLPLAVPLEAQYWAGSYYATNTVDSCTVIPMSSITMGNYQRQLSACKTQLSPVGNITLVAGKLPGAGLVLTKPGANNGGSVDLAVNVSATAAGNTCVSAAQSAATAANMPWLGPNLGGRATFGVYTAPIIYRRENY